MKMLQLMTYDGPIKFIRLSDFGDHIAMERCNSNTAYTILPQDPVEFLSNGTSPQELNNESSFKRVEIGPKLLLSINNHHLVSSRVNHRELLRDAVNKFVHKEVTDIVLKTKQSFIVENLSIEKIQHLSDEAMCKSMIDNAVAFTVVINDFSKFLVITSNDAFKLYISEEKAIFSIDYNGALLFIKPNMFVMGKYENPTYLSELSGKDRYPF